MQQPHPGTTGRRRAAVAGCFVAGVLGMAAVAVLAWSGASLPTSATTGSRPHDDMTVTIEGSEAPAGMGEPSVTCRRSDRSRSPCGPVLAVGRDASGEIVLARDDLVVIATGDEMVAHGLDDGDVRWRASPFRGARAVRMADDGDLLIAAVAGGLAAIDSVDGTVRWTRAFADGAPMEGTTSIAPVPVWAGDGAVLARDPDGRLHALDREDGAPRWVQELGQELGSEPIVTTTRGLVSLGREGLRLWHPDAPEPRWQRSGTDLPLHPETDDIEVALVGELTVVVTWPGRDSPSAPATVTAFDADGTMRWQQNEVALPCCTVRSVLADDGRVVLSVDGDPVLPRPDARTPTALVLSDWDGRVLETLVRQGATLEALTMTTEIWRTNRELLGIDRHTGREAFRALGTIVSVEPLLLEGPDATIAIRPHGPVAPAEVVRPGSRAGPDPPRIQGRGTAS